MFLFLASFFAIRIFPDACFVDSIWLRMIVFSRPISSWQTLQKSLPFETIKFSLGNSSTLTEGSVFFWLELSFGGRYHLPSLARLRGINLFLNKSVGDHKVLRIVAVLFFVIILIGLLRFIQGGQSC